MTDKIKVVITDVQKTLKVPKGMRMLIRRSCLAVLKSEDFRGSTEIHVILTDNAGICEQNQRFYGTSDVEEAVFAPSDSDGVLGEIYLSLEAALESASRYGYSLEREVVYLTVYSMLGILGNSDSVTAEERKQELMYALGFPMSASYSIAQ